MNLLNMRTLSLHAIIAMALLASCTHAPINVKLIDSDASQLMVVDEDEVNESRTLLLSDIAEDFRIVRFDNRDEALFDAGGMPTFSENYIAAGRTPVKLFTRDGKYICDVGGVGNGPGEYYISAYDVLIDEPADRIYVAGFGQAVNSYDLRGNFKGVVKLPRPLNKGKLFNNNDSTLSAIQLCFRDHDDNLFVAATFPASTGENDTVRYAFAPQLSTNFIDEEGYAVGFNNEIFSFRCSDRPTFHTTFNDTLYCYNAEANRLDAIFTLNMDKERKGDGYFVYKELPNHILVYIVRGNNPGTILIDKSEMKAWRIDKTVNDSFFNLKLGFNMHDGHVFGIYEPLELHDRLQKAIDRGEIADRYREDVDKLMATLNENDNNIMITARLRQ